MRLNSQNSQFIFLFPNDFIDIDLTTKFQKVLDLNFMPYDNVLDYINSQIKEVVFPSLSFEGSEMTFWKGKKIEYKEAGNVFDKFQNELDISMKSVDSHINYFMMVEILLEYYQNNKKQFMPDFSLLILDKYGNLIYTVIFKEILLKNIGELRMTYNQQDVNEKSFNLTFKYNFLDIIWELKDKVTDESKSVFDIPWEKGNDDQPFDITDRQLIDNLNLKPNGSTFG